MNSQGTVIQIIVTGLVRMSKEFTVSTIMVCSLMDPFFSVV